MTKRQFSQLKVGDSVSARGFIDDSIRGIAMEDFPLTVHENSYKKSECIYFKSKNRDILYRISYIALDGDTDAEVDKLFKLRKTTKKS